MPASGDSKFRAKRARQAHEAKYSSFKRDAKNDAPRNPNLEPRYGHYLPPLDRCSKVSADDLAARLKARERKALGKDD